MSAVFFAGREMNSPCTSGKFMSDYTLEEMRALSPEPTEAEKKDPFFCYYSEEMAPIEDAHKAVLEAGAMPAAGGFLPKDTGQALLTHDPAYPENGYCVLENGVGFASVLVHQDGLTDEMIAHFRTNFCRTENRELYYKIWYPHMHVIHFEDAIIESWGWGYCLQEMDIENVSFHAFGIEAGEISKLDPDCIGLICVNGDCLLLNDPKRRKWPMIMVQYTRLVPGGRELRVLYWNGIRANLDGSVTVQANPDREETLREMKGMFEHCAQECAQESALIRRFWADTKRQ